jgi:hypothetical protein
MAGGPPPAQASDEAELEAFRLALAAQASPAQVSAYSSLVNSTRIVVSTFEDMRGLLGKESVGPEFTIKKHAFDDSLGKARTSTKTLLESFSEPQRVALRRITSKMLSADSRLAERSGEFEMRIGDTTMTRHDLVGSSNRVEEAIANYREQERQLGVAMYALADPEEEQPIITLAGSMKASTIGNQTITVRTSGTIFRAPAERLSNRVHVQILANLGDLQQSLTQVLQSLLTHPDPCGERVSVQQSMLSIASPTAEVWVQLHLERWACMGAAGATAPVELMEGNGAITFKITPAMQKDGLLTILTQTEKVEANGMLAEILRSGALGDEVRERVKGCILRALQNGLDLEAVLLPVQSDSGAIETAKFVRDSQAGTLDIALDGHLRLSDQQIAELGGQKSGSP